MKIKVESAHFEMDDVVWATRSFHKGDLQPRPTTVTGIKSVSVTCKSCGYVWPLGDAGEDELSGGYTGILLKCPCCGSVEQINSSQMV